MALYNECGLDFGALKREEEMSRLYCSVSQALGGCTVYVVALQQRACGAELFAKAYIDYQPEDLAAALAKLAAHLASGVALPEGLECWYEPEEKIIHIGLWLDRPPSRETVGRWNKLWRAVG